MRTILSTCPVVIGLLLFPSAGCGKSEQPLGLVRETWDACYYDGSRIGYGHTAYYRELDAGRPIDKIVVDSKVELLRFGQKARQVSRETTWRSPDGSVLRFEVSTMLGESEQKTIGTVAGDKATLVLTAGGKAVTQPIDWPAGTRGSTGVEDELRAAPLKAGETRRFPMFLAMFNNVADVDLKHAGVESVEMEGARRDLTGVDFRATPKSPGAQHFDMTFWTDERGETLKMAIPMVQMTAVRTTAERAQAPITDAPTDLALAMFVRPDPPLADGHAKRFVRYQVKLADGSAAEAFPSATYQTVAAAADGSAEITVVALRPDVASPPGAMQATPGDADRRPNPFIESDDPQIVKTAAEQGVADPDPWTSAVRLEKFVKTYLRTVDFSKLFDTAGEAFRSRQGDCSEHAMLLCALLRARGIPARTAVGLVFAEKQQAFGYHMWTEAYIGDRWIPLDATVGRGGISAAYLKVSDTNFNGIDPLTTLLPVMKLLGRLKIGVLEAR